MTVSEDFPESSEETVMSILESLQLASPTSTADRSGLVALGVILAIGVILLVLMLAFPTGGSVAHHVAGAHVVPHLAR
jgi:hypothetical protein